jgi:hypothetical protein
MTVLLLSAPIFAQSDLAKYVDEARTSGMSETAASKLRFVASVMSGHAVIRVKRKADGSLSRSILGAACPLPGEAASDRSARLQAVSEAKREEWLTYFKKLADADGSGFVNSAEGETFERRLHLAFTVAQVPDVKSLDVLAELLDEDRDQLAEDLAAYPKLHATAERDGMKGLPSIPEQLQPAPAMTPRR